MLTFHLAGKLRVPPPVVEVGHCVRTPTVACYTCCRELPVTCQVLLRRTLIDMRYVH